MPIGTIDTKSMKFASGFNPTNIVVLQESQRGGRILAAFDGTYQNKTWFNLREMYDQDPQGPEPIWAPGKGINFPIEDKKRVLTILKDMLQGMEPL